MRFAVVLALCACNRAFSVGAPITERDARQFDGLGDAPYACPAIGTPLQFSSVIREVIAQDCTSYSTSIATDLATALCTDPDGLRSVYQGPVDEPMTPAIGIPTATETLQINWTRISPEGDLAFVPFFDLDAFVATVQTYTPAADGSWTRGADLPVPMFGLASVPTRGPIRHFIYYANGPPTEWNDQGTGTWIPGATLDLGPTPVRHVWLAADGLRLIASVDIGGAGAVTLIYEDRASIDDSFSPQVPVTTLPGTEDLFVSEDCSRAYLPSVHTIFYAYQR